MPPDRLELKKLSRNFRTVASRLLRTDEADGIVALKKFLNFIHSEEIVMRFITEKNRFVFDVGAQVKAIQNSYNEYPIPEDNDEEVAYVYQFLIYVAQNCPEYRHPISYAYGEKVQDQVDEFNKRIVLPFVNYVSSFLDELLLEVDEGTNRNHITIQAEGGQVNISQDKSLLSATQSITKVENDIDALFRMLVQQIQDTEIAQPDKEEVLEVMDLAKTEVAASAPKRSILKMAIRKLDEIKALGVASLATVKTIQDITTLISSFIK